MKPPIKEFRIKRKLTQTQVAEQAGITVTSYQRIEYGTQCPSLPTAIRIAKTPGTTVEKLWLQSRRIEKCSLRKRTHKHVNERRDTHKHANAFYRILTVKGKKNFSGE